MTAQTEKLKAELRIMTLEAERLERLAEGWKSRAMYEVEAKQALERDLQELMFKHAIPLYRNPDPSWAANT